MAMRSQLEATRRNFKIPPDVLTEKRDAGNLVFTSNGSRNGGHSLIDGHCPSAYAGTDMPCGGGIFAVHPRMLDRFYNMLEKTHWTMSFMIGTAARQFPLLDLDFHGADEQRYRP